MYVLYIENNIPYTKEMKCIIKNFLFNVLFEVRRIRRLRAPDVRHRYFHAYADVIIVFILHAQFALLF